MPLLVAEHHDVDAGIAARLLDRARGFQRVDAAERAVEPAGMVLAFQMRAGQRLARRVALRLAQDVADAVDGGLEPGRGALLGEPRCAPRCRPAEKVGRCTPVL